MWNPSLSFSQLNIWTDLSRDDLLVDLNGLVSKEWGITCGHLVYEHPQSPPVDCFIITLEREREREREMERERDEGRGRQEEIERRRDTKKGGQ